MHLFCMSVLYSLLCAWAIFSFLNPSRRLNVLFGSPQHGHLLDFSLHCLPVVANGHPSIHHFACSNDSIGSMRLVDLANGAPVNCMESIKVDIKGL